MYGLILRAVVIVAGADMFVFVDVVVVVGGVVVAVWRSCVDVVVAVLFVVVSGSVLHGL